MSSLPSLSTVSESSRLQSSEITGKWIFEPLTARVPSPAQPSPAQPILAQPSQAQPTWVGLLAAGEIAALLLCVGFEIFSTLCGGISSLPPFFRLLLCTTQRKLPVGGWQPIMVQASGVGRG